MVMFRRKAVTLLVSSLFVFFGPSPLGAQEKQEVPSEELLMELFSLLFALQQEGPLHCSEEPCPCPTLESKEFSLSIQTPSSGENSLELRGFSFRFHETLLGGDYFRLIHDSEQSEVFVEIEGFRFLSPDGPLLVANQGHFSFASSKGFLEGELQGLQWRAEPTSEIDSCTFLEIFVFSGEQEHSLQAQRATYRGKSISIEGLRRGPFPGPSQVEPGEASSGFLPPEVLLEPGYFRASTSYLFASPALTLGVAFDTNRQGALEVGLLTTREIERRERLLLAFFATGLQADGLRLSGEANLNGNLARFRTSGDPLGWQFQSGSPPGRPLDSRAEILRTWRLRIAGADLSGPGHFLRLTGVLGDTRELGFKDSPEAMLVRAQYGAKIGLPGSIDLSLRGVHSEWRTAGLPARASHLEVEASRVFGSLGGFYFEPKVSADLLFPLTEEERGSRAGTSILLDTEARSGVALLGIHKDWRHRINPELMVGRRAVLLQEEQAQSTLDAFHYPHVESFTGGGLRLFQGLAGPQLRIDAPLGLFVFLDETTLSRDFFLQGSLRISPRSHSLELRLDGLCALPCDETAVALRMGGKVTTFLRLFGGVMEGQRDRRLELFFEPGDPFLLQDGQGPQLFALGALQQGPIRGQFSYAQSWQGSNSSPAFAASLDWRTLWGWSLSLRGATLLSASGMPRWSVGLGLSL